MILPIIILGNPILRNVSVDITKYYEDLDVLINDMYDTLKKSNGVGLASPQIGLNINLFVTNINGFEKTYINPRIVNLDNIKTKGVEYCLSVPNIGVNVNRYDNIRIQYYDDKFKFHDEIYSGLLSCIVQHEYDHLKGILIVDYKN